jgi:hypothetical protein
MQELLGEYQSTASRKAEGHDPKGTRSSMLRAARGPFFGAMHRGLEQGSRELRPR